MTQLTSLAWKEWRESRWALIVGLGVFLVLPLIGALEDKASFGRFELLTMPVVLLFGGVLAVFAAIGASCRDLRPGLEDFWRSRPVSVVPWLLAKYFVALAMVLCACCLPLLVNIVLTPPTGDRTTAWLVFKWFPFAFTTQFSLAFLAGCTVRKISHATMLSLAAMLLVYFVPTLLPPVKWLSLYWVLQEQYERSDLYLLPFALGMLSVSAISLITSLVVVWRAWKVESGQKMVYWAIGLSLLLLFASAAYPLSNNLPLLDTVSLPTEEYAHAIYIDGHRGAIVSRNRLNYSVGGIYPLMLTASHMELGPRIDFPTEGALGFATGWLPERPQYVHLVYWIRTSPRHFTYLVQLIDLDNPKMLHMPKRVCDVEGDDTGYDQFYGSLFYSQKNSLYLRGGDRREIAVVDVTVPDEPRFAFTDHWDSVPTSREKSGPDSKMIIYEVPSPASFSAKEALAHFKSELWRVHGNELAMADDEGLTIYRQLDFTRNKVRFLEVGHCDPTPLEKLFGDFSSSNAVFAGNRLVYIAHRGRAGFLKDQYRLTVFDTSDATRPHAIGHFGLPQIPDVQDYGMSSINPLADGRAIIGRTKLYLVGKPPHFRE